MVRLRIDGMIEAVVIREEGGDLRRAARGGAAVAPREVQARVCGDDVRAEFGNEASRTPFLGGTVVASQPNPVKGCTDPAGLAERDLDIARVILIHRAQDLCGHFKRGASGRRRFGRVRNRILRLVIVAAARQGQEGREHEAS